MPERRGPANRLADILFWRGPHGCPWWLCYTFDNPLRRLVQRPERILRPYVRPGDRVLDVGAGMGYFSIPLARLVGASGHVVAVDLDERMLRRVRVRAGRAGVAGRIETVRSDGRSLGVKGPFDFALAHWMLHEVPDKETFLVGVADVLSPGGHLLIVEPRLHVAPSAFEQSVEAAVRAGFVLEERPNVPLSRAVLLHRGS